MDMYIPSIEDNSHLANVVEKFGAFQPTPLNVPDDCGFVFLCFTNRCGSNYLAELLASSQHYNNAGELLNSSVIVKRSGAKNLETFQQYFEYLIGRSLKNGKVIVKVGIAQIELLGRAGILQQIRDRSAFILMERGDKLNQAISHSLAFGTRRFTSEQEGSKAPEEVAFSARKLEKIITKIVNTYREFDVFFARNGIVPVNITYEQLMADAVAFGTYAARQAGLEQAEISPERVAIARQANALNQRWREMYLHASKTEPSADRERRREGKKRKAALPAAE